MRKHFFLFFLVVSHLFCSMDAGAATCSSKSGGNWSNPSMWNCGHVPGSSDTASIVGDLTVDIDVTVVSLSLDFNSNLIFGNHTITLSGIQPITNGELAPGNKSTIILSNADHYVSAGTFYNLILVPLTAPRTITLIGKIWAVGDTFLSGTDATNKVSFKTLMGGGVNNPVTSYFCASNGGITNITCLPGAPPPKNAAPTATGVTISGTAVLGQILTGSYTYADAENDPQGTSTFKWYTGSDNTCAGKKPITGAISKTYKAQAGDLGKFICFGVTPVATSGTLTGTEVITTTTGIVLLSNAAGMTVSPASLTFTAIQGGANPAAQSVTVTNTDGALSLTYGVVSQPNYMLTVSSDSTAILWNSDIGAKVRTFTDIASAAFSSDGKTILTVNYDGTGITLWNVATLTGTPISVPGMGVSVAFTPDGTKFLTVNGDDSTVKVRNAATGAVITSLATGDVSTAVFSPDGTKILTGSADGAAKIWNISTGAVIRTVQDSSQLTSAAYSPDGTKILTSGIIGGGAKVWDAATGTLLLTLTGHASNVNSAAFSPDGTKIITASSDSTVKVWDAAAGGAALRTLIVSDKCTMSFAAFSLNGKKIVTSYNNGMDRIYAAAVWDAATGTTPLQTVTDHTDDITTVTFSPITAFAAPAKTGGTIAAGGGTDTVPVSPDISGLQPGTYKNTLVIDGGSAGKQNVEITLVITAPGAANTAPTVKAEGIANVSVATGASPTAIDVSKAFADTEDGATGLTYSVLTNTNTILVNPTVAGQYLNVEYSSIVKSGTADITVRGTDKGGLYADAKFTVTVAADACITDIVFVTGILNSVSFSATCFDLPAKDVIYSAKYANDTKPLPSWACFWTGRRMFTSPSGIPSHYCTSADTTPAALSTCIPAGVTSLDITVSAKSKTTGNIVGKKLFNLTVTNAPPVIAQAGAQVGTVNQGASTITLNIAGTESAPLTYEIVGSGYKVTYKGTVYIVTKNGTQGFSVDALTGRRDNETRDSSSMLIMGFDKPVYSVSASASDNGGGSTFSAYDANNNLLKTVLVTGSTPTTYTISDVGEIAKVIFASTNGWIGNLAYSVNVIPGDINFDRSSDLADAILMLQALSDIELPDLVYPQLTISGTRIGIEDVIINLQQVAGLR